MSDMESLNKQEIGFLKEQIERLERRVDAGFATITAKLEILTEQYVKIEEVKEMIKPLANDIESLQSDRQWAVRIVLGTVITAILGTVIVIAKLKL